MRKGGSERGDLPRVTQSTCSRAGCLPWFCLIPCPALSTYRYREDPAPGMHGKGCSGREGRFPRQALGKRMTPEAAEGRGLDGRQRRPAIGGSAWGGSLALVPSLGKGSGLSSTWESHTRLGLRGWRLRHGALVSWLLSFCSRAHEPAACGKPHPESFCLAKDHLHCCLVTALAVMMNRRS